MSLYQHPNHLDLSRHDPQAKSGTDIAHEFDVVIIGTGAGGGIAAHILTQAGLSVCMVEEGPLKTRHDFTMKESSAYPNLYQEAAARKTKDKGISILQGRSVGGSTTVNWTSSFRTPKATLEFWQSRYQLLDWSWDALLPWFEQIEQLLNMKPWSVAPNTNNQILLDGAQKLGWQAGIITRNVKGCANLGYCGMGCPLDAKQSMLVTTIPQAMEAGAKLYSRARCERIISDAHQVSGVEIRAMDEYGQVTERQLELKCRHLILAAGAIGTPAVLLRSQMDDPYQRIGKRTFLHPVTAVTAQMKNRVEPYSGAPQSVYSDHFLWRDGVDGKAGYKLEVPPIHPVLGSSLIPLHGEAHKEVFSQLPYMHATLALLRDGFHPLSQGGQVELDEFGYPRLDYPLNEFIWEGVRHAMLSMAELQFAAGAKRVRSMHMDADWYSSWSEAKRAISALPLQTLRCLLFSAHVMGGAPMGADPQNSVVDSEGRFHFRDNLWVMDGSLLPTSLGVNPQLSIYAISAKLASNLAKRLQSR
jgi:choline dehydrogenase-like flavoprotein